MKFLLCMVVCAAVAAGEGTAKMAALSQPVADYHRRVGIPAAERIRFAEARASKDPRWHIVGGTLASLPFQAGLIGHLLDQDGTTSACGASLISHTRLVTAAHCWQDASNQMKAFTVVLGSRTLFTGGIRTTTNQVSLHEEYDPHTAANDIAIVTMLRWVGFNRKIKPVRLPTGNETRNEFVGERGFASGFGETGDQTGISEDAALNVVKLQIISNEMCQQWSHPTPILPSMLCTSGVGGVGSCSGDSGGPLTVRSEGSRVLVGIISFGFGSCQRGDPSVYTRVTSFLRWIQERL